MLDLMRQQRRYLLARSIEQSVGGWMRHPGDKIGLIGSDGAAWALLVVASGREGELCENCGCRAFLLLTRPLELRLCWWCWRELEG